MVDGVDGVLFAMDFGRGCTWICLPGLVVLGMDFVPPFGLFIDL